MIHGRIEMVGCFGVGKSTLLKACQVGQVETHCLFENLDNITEEITYWNNLPSERTYFIQTIYYLEAYNLIHSVSSLWDFNVVLSDFSLLFHHYGYSHALKQCGLLSDIEWRALEILLNLLQSNLPPLIGLIYCKASQKTLITRIRERSRVQEIDIDYSFVAQLADTCNTTLRQVACPILELDFDACDLSTAADLVTQFTKSLSSS
jgi:deoxyadenosine/deoxycytidine kinase